MLGHRRYTIAAIITLTLIITSLHYITTPGHVLHNIQTELHYIPLILGAILFGFKGAVVTFILITVLYLPYFFTTWNDPVFSIINRLVHITLSGLIACLAGVLVDREKKYRRQSEKDRYLAGLGQAAAAIVHDLKNPLITVLGFARRIREGKGDIGAASEAVMSSAKNMQMIVHDVLDFARPVKLRLSERYIGNVLKQAADSCKTKAEREKVTLSIKTPSEPVKIIIDGFHLERALINLINNAIDASDRGRSVSISAAAEKDFVVIRIRDSGKGMDRETIENVFIPFFSRKSSGTGLGMAIAKKIIDEHQGKIHINSKEAFGTEVIIALPHIRTSNFTII
jgi:signal transduction histidine kinase